jgi:hypothetical protein
VIKGLQREFCKIFSIVQDGGVATRDKLAAYQKQVNLLSQCQYYTLYYLIQHLRVYVYRIQFGHVNNFAFRIASHQHENKMNAVSLGMVFAPLLFRSQIIVTENYTIRSISPGKEKSDEVPYADQVVEAFIEHADDIFSDLDDDSV